MSTGPGGAQKPCDQATRGRIVSFAMSPRRPGDIRGATLRIVRKPPSISGSAIRHSRRRSSPTTRARLGLSQERGGTRRHGG
jgi:hypothetical protein